MTTYDVAREVVSRLLAACDTSGDGGRRVELLHQAASVYEEQLSDPHGAFHAMLRAWGDDYANPRTTAALARLADRIEGWTLLWGVAHKALRSNLPLKQRAALCLQCATWYEHLGCPDDAIDCYEEVLIADPRHQTALLSLATLYEGAEQWHAAFILLDRLTGIAQRPEERFPIFLRLAELCEGPMQCPAKAANLYREVIRLNPRNVVAAEALERILARQERWEDAARLLEQRAEGISDAKLASKIWLRLAQIFRERLGKTDRAIDAYGKALKCDDMSLPALHGLETLLSAGERFRELAEVLEGQVRAATEKRDRVDILIRLATLWEQKFIRPDKAVAFLEEACAIDGEDRTVRKELARLYRQAERWPDLLSTLEALLLSASPAERENTLNTIAELCMNELDDAPRAIRAYEELVARHGHNLDALQRLLMLHERAGNPRAVVLTLERLSQAVSDESALSALYFRMGRICESELLDFPTSLASYARAADLGPSRADILFALRRAQIRAREFRGASLTLLREIEVADSSRALCDLHVLRARILRDELKQMDEAVVHLEQACAEDPDNARAAMMLSNAYVEASDWTRALPLLERVVRGSCRQARPGVDDPRVLDPNERMQAAALLSEAERRRANHTFCAAAFQSAIEFESDSSNNRRRASGL